MARGNIPNGRAWLNISEAGTYVGINPEVIRRAIERGELPARRKPLTYGEGVCTTKAMVKMHRDDIDAWIRDYWEPYAPQLPAVVA